jgi:hypothetical protein
MPTPRQLAEASKLNVSGFGIVERMSYFVRHPQDLFSTKNRKRNLLRVSMPDGAETPRAELQTTPLPLVDKVLRSAYQFPPLRFLTACCFNPYFWPIDPIGGTGLTIPRKNLISHILHPPHHSALWDVQIVHADEGGLDELERELEETVTGRGLKPHVYRAMTQRMAYYPHLRDLLPRVRRFDYPLPPREVWDAGERPRLLLELRHDAVEVRSRAALRADDPASSSRTRAWLSRWPIAGTCWRRALSCCRTPAPGCWPTPTSSYLGRAR